MNVLLSGGLLILPARFALTDFHVFCFRCFPVAATYFHLQAIVQQIFPGLAHRITGLRPLPEDSFAGVADPVCTSNRAVCYVEFRHVVFRVFRTFAEAHVRCLLCSAPSGKGHAPEAVGLFQELMGQARVAAGAVLLLHVLVRLGDLVRWFSSLACE